MLFSADGYMIAESPLLPVVVAAHNLQRRLFTNTGLYHDVTPTADDHSNPKAQA